MRTELCERFGIEFPIFAFSHCRDVVAAVSQAGGFGVLGAVGLPLEGIGMIVAVDWLLDRFRTAINVWGDSVGSAVIDRYVASEEDAGRLGPASEVT